MNKNTKEINTKLKYSASESFIGSLIYAVLLAYIPTVLLVNIGEIALEAFSVAAVALFVFALYKLTKSKRALVSFIVPAAILFVLGGSFIVFSMIVAIIGSVVLLACLIYKAKTFASGAFPIILTVTVYLALAIAVDSFLYPTICFAFLPAALVLAACLYAKTPRVSTVCRMSAAFILPSVIAFAVWFFGFAGGDIQTLKELLDFSREKLAELYAEGMILVGMAENTPETYTYARESMILLFNLLPAFVITAANITAYLLHSFAASLIVKDEDDKETVTALYYFKMSTGSAVVFFVFLILYAAFMDEARPELAMAALNVVAILVPGLINTTLVSLKRLTYSKKASCFGFVIYFGAIMLLINLPEYSFIVGALIGAVILVVSAARSAIMKSAK